MAGTVRNNWLSATDKQAALERIGFYRHTGRGAGPVIDRWNVLNWFVRLANTRKPYQDMPTAQVELLTHEYRALQEEDHPPGARFGLVQNIVSLSELEKFRTEARRHVEELADTGRTEFGPFQLRRSMFVFPLDDAEIHGTEIATGDYVEPWSGQGLLLLMSNLLSQVGLAIRRCPRPECKKTFLRPRRNAQYCSRLCQARAAAKAHRERGEKQNFAKQVMKKVGNAKGKVSRRPPRQRS